MTLGGSYCSISVVRAAGETIALKITLRGDAAIFPSTSNSRDIGYKWGTSRKTGRRTKLPFIRKSKFQTDRLALITAAYAEAVVSEGVMPPAFNDEPVTVFCVLARAANRFDSHNFSKPIGDWLQSVGVINDDSRAEIFCIKRDDYANLRGGEFRTDIYVLRRENAGAFVDSFFESARRTFGEV